jgi:sulfofructose kinase
MKLPIAPLPPGAALFDVVGFGESSLDFVGVLSEVPSAGGKASLEALEMLPGGQVATALVACARLGWRARYHGVIGAGAWGAAVESVLARERVEIARVSRDGARSRAAIVLVQATTGDRTVLEYRDPTLRLGVSDVALDVITSGRVLLVDAIDPDASRAAAQAAREKGIPTVVDVDRVAPGIEVLLDQIDVLVVPRSFATVFTGAASVGAALEELTARFRPAMSVVTLGAEGSLALLQGREIRTRSPAVPVVDTTGAGDAFRGGLIAAWLERGGEAAAEDLLAYANAVAAISCSRLGAMTGLPDRETLRTFVTGSARG